MMKTSKNKRRQQQKGRPVLVTFYVLQPRRDGEGGARTRTTLSHDDVRHHHHHHLHYGDVYDERRRWTGGRSQSNRRADLLEYSRQLRALARQTTTTTAAPLPQPLPPRLQRHGTETVRALQDPFPRCRNILSLYYIYTYNCSFRLLQFVVTTRCSRQPLTS
jgi:hypothetical protein